MVIEHEKRVMERYIHAVMRALPPGWHCITVLMMADSDDPATHSLGTYLDVQPTSVPALLRHIADALDAHNPPPQTLVDLNRGTDMPHARFEIVEDSAERYVIRDVGHDAGLPTVTNDAEAVVAALALRVGKRRLFYYDSDGRLDELLIRDGKFAGYRAGPGDGKL